MTERQPERNLVPRVSRSRRAGRGGWRLALCLLASLVLHAGVAVYMQRHYLSCGHERQFDLTVDLATKPVVAPDFHWEHQDLPVEEEPLGRPLATHGPEEVSATAARQAQAALAVSSLPPSPTEPPQSLVSEAEPIEMARVESRPPIAEPMVDQKVDRGAHRAEMLTALADPPVPTSAAALPAAQSAPTIVDRKENRVATRQPLPEEWATSQPVAAVNPLVRQDLRWSVAAPSPVPAAVRGSLSRAVRSLPEMVPELRPPDSARALPEVPAEAEAAGGASRAARGVPKPAPTAVPWAAMEPRAEIGQQPLTRHAVPSDAPTSTMTASVGAVRAPRAASLAAPREREVPTAVVRPQAEVISVPPTEIAEHAAPAVVGAARPMPLLAELPPIRLEPQRLAKRTASQAMLSTGQSPMLARQTRSEPIVSTLEPATPLPAAHQAEARMLPAVSAARQEALPPARASAGPAPTTASAPAKTPVVHPRKARAAEIPLRSEPANSGGVVRDPSAAQVPVSLAMATAVPPAEETKRILTPSRSSEPAPVRQAEPQTARGVAGPWPEPANAAVNVPTLPARKSTLSEGTLPSERTGADVLARDPAAAQSPVFLAMATAVPPAEEAKRILTPSRSSEPAPVRQAEVLPARPSAGAVAATASVPAELPAVQSRRAAVSETPLRSERDQPGALARDPSTARVPAFGATATAVPPVEELRRVLTPRASAETQPPREVASGVDLSPTYAAAGVAAARARAPAEMPAIRASKTTASERALRLEPARSGVLARDPSVAQVPVYMATAATAPPAEETRRVAPVPQQASSAARTEERLAVSARAPGASLVSEPLGAARSEVSQPALRRLLGEADRETLAASLPAAKPSDRPPRSSTGLAIEGRILEAPAESFRQREPGTRAERVKAFGGSDTTERTVELALEYLARCQFADGRWSLHRVPERLLALEDPALGQMQSDTAATGLALLAMLGAGYTHRDGKYQTAVERALGWLVATQKPEGDLFAGGTSFAWFYSQGIGAIALCEAYGMTADPRLRRPAWGAVDFILRSQHPELGGWRYFPREESDTSVTGWQLMALKSAQMAHLPVPDAALGKIGRWLDSAQAGKQGGLYCYNPLALDTTQQRGGRTPSLAMTAEGLLMRVYLGWPADHAGLREGAEYLTRHLPAVDNENPPSRDAYYWYYATQFMFQIQGEAWRAWHKALYPLLEDMQVRTGPWAGSWHPLRPTPDRWGEAGGRLYVTAMHLLMLEVYYRHLPLFQLAPKES